MQRLTVGKEHPLTETRSSQADVVVIGGGMAGLTAACYLARAGVGVTLFEKAPYLGGRAATREFDGFLFNRGGHALYTGGATSRIFEELGVTYGHGIPKDTFVLQGGKLSSFPADPLGLLRTDVLDAGDKLALVRLFVALGQTASPGEDEHPGIVRPQDTSPATAPADDGARAHLRLQYGAGHR